jgi:hypothetical protein
MGSSFFHTWTKALYNFPARGYDFLPLQDEMYKAAIVNKQITDN